MAVSGAAVVGMMALVTFEVLLRTFANRSTLVADEMAGYLLVAMTFLGLAPSLRGGAFIRIDTYRDRLRGGARRALDVALVAVALAYAITIHKSQGSEFPAVVIPLLLLQRPGLKKHLKFSLTLLLRCLRKLIQPHMLIVRLTKSARAMLCISHRLPRV